MATLETHGLVKQFRGSVVVDHVDLRVNSGEIVGLLGPNGAGKTTCFYMICGLTRRGDGLVQLDNSRTAILFYQSVCLQCGQKNISRLIGMQCKSGVTPHLDFTAHRR